MAFLAIVHKEAARIVTRSFLVALENSVTTVALMIEISGQRDLQSNTEEMHTELRTLHLILQLRS